MTGQTSHVWSGWRDPFLIFIQGQQGDQFTPGFLGVAHNLRLQRTSTIAFFHSSFAPGRGHNLCSGAARRPHEHLHSLAQSGGRERAPAASRCRRLAFSSRTPGASPLAQLLSLYLVCPGGCWILACAIMEPCQFCPLQVRQRLHRTCA